MSNNETNTLEFWYQILGSSLIQDVIYLSLIPIGIIGIIFNILTLLVLRSDKFNLSFYTYLRAYTISSIFICFLSATRFSSNIYQNLLIQNSAFSLQFFCYVYIPVTSGINVFESTLDIILSMERLAILSKRIHWFGFINAKKLCFILAFVFIILAIPYWFFFKPQTIVTNILFSSGTTRAVTFHFFIPRYDHGFIAFYMNIFPYFVDILPIVIEICLNILTIISVKKYTKNRIKLFNNNKNRDNEILALNQSNITNSSTPTSSLAAVKNLTLDKSKIAQVKLTILVIILSIMSIL
jgi:hypothetical protein